MKKIFQKRINTILITISFLTFFSAVLYATEPIYCEKDTDCPPGMMCDITQNYCVQEAIITCTAYPNSYEPAYCWIETIGSYYPEIIYICTFTGVQSDTCTMPAD